MFYIAICDNDIAIGSDVKKMIEDYSIKQCIEVGIYVFDTEDAFLNYIVDHHIGVLFLDVELNSMDIGNWLRRELKNASLESPAMQLIRIYPLDILIKPLDYQKVEKVLHQVCCNPDGEPGKFKFKIGNVCYQIPEKDIYYFQSKGRMIELTTRYDKKFKFYGKLSDIKGKLPSDEFMAIHKSYLVRAACIKEYRYTTVTIENNDILQISQSYQKKVRELLNQRNE